tara:strand:+ start:1504 stop:1752 length:249 start_codon:yes stop_codon:yes gene_type:complete
MQKIVNVISIFSGLVSLTIVGVTGYVYLNRVSLIENAKENVTKAAIAAVADALPGIVDSAIPEIPSSTGGISGITGKAIPFR